MIVDNVQKVIPKIFAKKKNWKILKFYPSSGLNKVFSIASFPNIIFKASVGQDLSHIYNENIINRFRNISKARRVCQKFELNHLVVPQSKIIELVYQNKKIVILAQEKINCNATDSMQEEFYLKNPDRVKDAVFQLFVLICETGYSDVCWRNNPIINNYKIALIDLEEMVGSRVGVIGRPPHGNSLIKLLDEKQAEWIIQEASERFQLFHADNARRTLNRRKEELAEMRRINDFHQSNEIKDSEEKLEIVFDDLELPENLCKPTQVIVREINRLIHRKSAEESIIGRRNVVLEAKQICWKEINSQPRELRKMMLESITSKDRHFHKLFRYMSRTPDELSQKEVASRLDFDHRTSVLSIVLQKLDEKGHLYSYEKTQISSYTIQA